MNEQQKRRVRRLVKQGYTAPQIAARMDINQERVQRLCRQEGLEVKGRLPRSTRVLMRKVAELQSVAKVASYYGVTRSAVYWRLDKERNE